MRKILSHLATSTIAVCVVFVVARAAGTPTTNPLVYRGVLEEAGAPVSGARNVALRVWNDATATAAANLACNVIPGSPTQIEGGRFDIVLGTECVAAVRDNPDLWIEVLVDNVSLGRSPVGAVPYALETGRPTYVNPSTKQGSSVGGYCGSTGMTTGAITNGYAGAKDLCETACSSATAHVCTGDEIVRSASTGTTMPEGRYQAGLACTLGSMVLSDCASWTSSSSNLSGPYWSLGLGGLGCHVAMPLLCCD